jgi:general secretion pathway protein D
MQLPTIIKLVAESTGRTFLIQRVPMEGTVTIYCPKMLPASAAFDILGIILDSQGYTMAVTDDPPLVFVTKKVGAAPIPTEVQVTGEGPGPEGKRQLATLIVILKYVSVDDMQNLLRNFMSPGALMTAYQAGNFLLLKDDEKTLKYLLSIVEKVDVPGTTSKVTMIELKYAEATEAASLLTELLAAKEGGRVTTGPTALPPTPPGAPGRPTAGPMALSPTIVGTATPLKIIPDTRTNRLIILASERATDYILDLVKKLDVEPTEEMYPIRTYVAQYQKAEDLADTLTAFVSGRTRTRTAQQRATTTRAQRQTATARTRRQQGVTPAGPTVTMPGGPGGGGTEEAFFLADPATNMILVQAPPQKLDFYLALLKELDQPQKQVLIEVWVVEVSSKSQLDIGVEFKPADVVAGSTAPMQNEIVSGTDFGLGLSSLLSGGGFATSGVSLAMRSLGNTRFELGDKVYRIPSFDAFLSALRGDTKINILSSPKLATLNNEPASVEVSEEISIAESRIASYATLEAQAQTTVPGAVTETYQRQSVGILLDITPQINSADSVIMEINLEVSSIAEAGVRPVIAQRFTTSKVRVDNERTVVISGLRRTDKTKTGSRVPIIGQIPILGLLFSSESTITMNTNLLVFITPHIISDSLDMAEVTDRLKNQDLERERSRFQPAKETSKPPRAAKAKASPGLEWKK